MKTLILHASKYKIHKKNLVHWVESVCCELKQLHGLPPLLQQILQQKLSCQKNLTIAFITAEEMQNLNQKFRNKKGLTDILSFASVESDSLGELVLCYSVICQKNLNEFTDKQWLYYLILHGILHLLGMEHEKCKKEAQVMYDLQDTVFKKIVKNQNL